jgi:hypothetical protein
MSYGVVRSMNAPFLDIVEGALYYSVRHLVIIRVLTKSIFIIFGIRFNRPLNQVQTDKLFTLITYVCPHLGIQQRRMEFQFHLSHGSD